MGDEANESIALKSHIRSDSSTHLVPNETPSTSSHATSDESGASKAWCSSLPRRYVLAFLAFFGFCNIYALRSDLSVAIVAMVNSNDSVFSDNSSFSLLLNLKGNSGRFDWDSKQQGILLSAFFYGYIVTQIPGGYLACRYGGKRLFGFGVVATAILTLLTPLAAAMGFPVLVACRVLEGLCEGVTYPAIQAIWGRWAPALEKTRLATIAFSGSYVGTVISMPLSGFIAWKFGWPSVFYLFGFLGVLWFLLWWFFTFEDPAEHPAISKDELAHIKTCLLPDSREHVPWRCILRSGAVWAIVVAHFAENWGFYTMLTLLPTFLSSPNTFGLTLTKASFLSGLPYLAMAFILVLGGFLVDFVRKRELLSNTGVRKLFTCAGFISQTVFLVVLAYSRSASLALAMVTISVGLGGFAWSGFAVNPLDIAPQYASIIFGISNTFATLPGIISPALAGAMTMNGTFSEWQLVFFIASAIYLLGAILYGLLARGNLEPWAEYHAHQTHTS